MSLDNISDTTGSGRVYSHSSDCFRLEMEVRAVQDFGTIAVSLVKGRRQKRGCDARQRRPTSFVGLIAPANSFLLDFITDGERSVSNCLRWAFHVVSRVAPILLAAARSYISAVEISAPC